MKKSFIAIATLLTFLLFSCATDQEMDAQDLTDDISAPATVDSENNNDTSLVSDLLPSELLPEPEDFEEPLVRDLDISELPEESIITPAIEIKKELNEEIKPESVATVPSANEPEKTEVIQQQKVETTTPATKTPAVEISKNSETKKTEAKKTEESKKSETASNQNQTAITEKPATVNTVVEEEKTIVPLVEKEVQEIIPSRKVTINTNETLTITYPGYGWIYLGSESENNNLVSTGRKVENEETVYTLTAKKPGTQLQHFYKVDTISGNFIDDYIEVEVLDNKGSVYTIVKAPDYAEVVPERAEVPAVASSNNTITTAEILEKEVKPTEKRSYETYVPETETVNSTIVEPSIPKPAINDYTENLGADDLLAKAKNLFDEKKYADSQKYVNNFMEIATEKRDEGLYLQGQIFEQDGVTKNIKESIASYTTLVESYPESDLWDAANKRIIYLNRFYIQIR